MYILIRILKELILQCTKRILMLRFINALYTTACLPILTFLANICSLGEIIKKKKKENKVWIINDRVYTRRTINPSLITRTACIRLLQ